MTRLAKSVGLLGLALCLTYCVTATGGNVASDPGGRVVERSKPEPPAWTSFAAGSLHEAETAFNYVEVKTRLRDLPLGLKTTQLGAVEASRNAVQAMVRSRLESDIGGLSPTALAEFDRQLTEATSDAFNKFAKVQDIYFEKLTSDLEGLPEYFNAFVLVTMPKDHLTDLYLGLARRLGASSDRSLKGLGQSLESQSKSGGLSH